METPGEFLRKKREAEGRSLEEISRRTNIRADVLRNLEADLYGFAPAPVYIVGALTAYAKALGVDRADVLERYRAMSEPRKPEIVREPEAGRPRVRVGWRGIALAAVVVVVAVGGMLWLRKSPAPRERTSPGTVSPAAASETSGVVPALREIPSEKVVLEMAVRESTWVGLEMDGERRYSALLGPGAWKRWEADSVFSIRIGNAGGVTLTLNGHPVDLPRERGRVVMLDLPRRDDRAPLGAELTRPAAVVDTSGAR